MNVDTTAPAYQNALHVGQALLDQLEGCKADFHAYTSPDLARLKALIRECRPTLERKHPVRRRLGIFMNVLEQVEHVRRFQEEKIFKLELYRLAVIDVCGEEVARAIHSRYTASINAELAAKERAFHDQMARTAEGGDE